MLLVTLIVHLELFLDGGVYKCAGGPGQLCHQLVVDGFETFAQSVDEVPVEETFLALLRPVLGVVLNVNVRQRRWRVR